MNDSKDRYVTCPRCGHVGWHKYKKKAVIIFGYNHKYKVSLFKCSMCGKKFGFDLDGQIHEEEKDA